MEFMKYTFPDPQKGSKGESPKFYRQKSQICT